MEKIQITAFSIQEFIISAMYLYETHRILKPSATFQKKRTRQVMLHLIYGHSVTHRGGGGGDGGVAMQTFDGDAVERGPDQKDGNNTYTVFAGRAVHSPFNGMVDDGRVMKTTDIAVTTELAQQSDSEVEKNNGDP